jgi:electron transfer flavoprotein beta subunit
MKIMVCLKQVPHQDARLDVNAEHNWIKEDGIKFEINSYDTYALEEALRIKDAGEAEVVAVSIGPDRVTQALRTALGMGADRAIHVKDPETEGSDTLGIAKILAAIAKEESPDLIFMGMMSDDGNYSAVPPMLAELAGVPHATAAVAVTRSNGTLSVDREIEGGAREELELQAPCLVAVQTGMNQVRYASLKGIMAAKKKPRGGHAAAEGRESGDPAGLERRDRRGTRQQDQGAGAALGSARRKRGTNRWVAFSSSRRFRAGRSGRRATSSRRSPSRWPPPAVERSRAS